MTIYKAKVGEVMGDLTHKVGCWGKSESSEESKKTSEERESNANEHSEGYKEIKRA